MTDIMTYLEELHNFLGEGRRHKLAILCIGNVLISDDALGSIIAEKLREKISPDILLFDVGSQPVNFLSVLKQMKCHIV